MPAVNLNQQWNKQLYTFLFDKCVPINHFKTFYFFPFASRVSLYRLYVMAWNRLFM